MATTASDRAATLNAALNKALGHPLKAKILQRLDEAEGCCGEVAEDLNEDYFNVSYHLRKLAEPVGEGLPALLELVDTDTKRGGTQKIYKTAVRPEITGVAWEKLPRLIRETHSVHVGQTLLDEMVDAIKAGTFDARADRSQVRTVVVVDEAGWRDLGGAVEDFLRRVQDIEAESCERRVNTGGKGIDAVVGGLAFERAPFTEQDF